MNNSCACVEMETIILGHQTVKMNEVLNWLMMSVYFTAHVYYMYITNPALQVTLSFPEMTYYIMLNFTHTHSSSYVFRVIIMC